MDDLIRRQDAIEIFSQLWDCIEEIADKEEWEDVCKTTANELPPAQPEVLAHGKGESTSNGIMLMIGDDGIAREYSDEFDVVIHCESEEERKKVIEIINSKQWIPCSERLPKISSERLALRYSNGLVSGGTYLGNKTFDVDFPDCNKKTTVMEWMPLPKLYKEKDEVEE